MIHEDDMTRHQAREELLLHKILDQLVTLEQLAIQASSERAYMKAMMESHKATSALQHERIMTLEVAAKKQLYLVIGGLGTVSMSTIGLLASLLLGAFH